MCWEIQPNQYAPTMGVATSFPFMAQGIANVSILQHATRNTGEISIRNNLDDKEIPVPNEQLPSQKLSK
jgi:hypothetical protein